MPYDKAAYNREYYKKHKEYFRNYHKEHRDKNKQKNDKCKKAYYDKNKDKILEKIKCIHCNRIVCRTYMPRHILTDKCKRLNKLKLALEGLIHNFEVFIKAMYEDDEFLVELYAN